MRWSDQCSWNPVHVPPACPFSGSRGVNNGHSYHPLTYTRRLTSVLVRALIAARSSKLAMRVRFPSPAPPHPPAETVPPPPDHGGPPSWVVPLNATGIGARARPFCSPLHRSFISSGLRAFWRSAATRALNAAITGARCVLVDQRGPHRSVSHAVHQLAGGRTRCGGELVPGVAKIMEMEFHFVDRPKLLRRSAAPFGPRNTRSSGPDPEYLSMCWRCQRHLNLGSGLLFVIELVRFVTR
jgi:hypothetical protein